MYTESSITLKLLSIKGFNEVIAINCYCYCYHIIILYIILNKTL